MCLAVPGKIVEISEASPFGRSGRVSFGGVIKNVSLAYVPEAQIGDYVLVHAGFAISIVDEEAAAETWRYLAQMAALTQEEQDAR